MSADDEHINWNTNENGEYTLEMKVSKIFYGNIIGAKGAKCRELKAETGCKIKVPSKTDPDGCVVLTGPTPNSIIQCKDRINMLIKNARFCRQFFTHFPSVPMNNETIQANFLKFKEDILKLGDLRGVDEELFQSPFKLHLTIGVLVIGDEDIIKVSNLFLKLKLNILDTALENTGPLQIHMKGLDYMGNDPTKINVLYAKIQIENDTTSLMQRICDELIAYLVDEGLMLKERDHVNLHVTVMNTRYRKAEDGSRLKGKRKTFDAVEILRKFSDYDFGVQKFNKIHLSIRSTIAEDTGYYKAAYIQEF